MGKLIGMVFSRLFLFLGVSSKLGRMFFATIFLSLFFVLIYNVACELILDLMTWAVNKAVSTDISSLNSVPTVSLSGCAAWVLLKFRFPECISLILSAYPIRIILKSIPFIRLN